jgi:hypothetical protein
MPASTSGFTSGGPEGMTVAESARTAAVIGNAFDREDTPPNNDVYLSGAPDGSYDPIQMGALKQTEVDAHNRGVSEMTPFNYLGPAKPSSAIRDDNDYMRNTGITPIGGLNPRTVNAVASGPQAGSRQAPSASDKDIQDLHLQQKYAATSPYG